jgi:hypothetical protein
VYLAELSWRGKAPTRLPESAWLEVRPELSRHPPGCTLNVDKLGGAVDTADVVPDGGAYLHGSDPSGGIAWMCGTGQSPPTAEARVRSLDAALVAPGSNTNLYRWDAYNSTPPNAQDGAAFNLLNNLYATNYILWYPWNAEDAQSRFRFEVTLKASTCAEMRRTQ